MKLTPTSSKKGQYFTIYNDFTKNTVVLCKYLGLPRIEKNWPRVSIPLLQFV